MAIIVSDAVGILALPAQAVADGQGRGGCQGEFDLFEVVLRHVRLPCCIRARMHITAQPEFYAAPRG